MRWRALLILLVARTAAGLSFEQEPESRLVDPAVEGGPWPLRCLPRPPSAQVRWWGAGGLPQRGGQKTSVAAAERPFQCEIRHQGRAMLSAPAKIVVAELAPFPPPEGEVEVVAAAGQTAVIPCSPPHSVPNVVTEFLFNGSRRIDRTQGAFHLMPSGDLQIFGVREEEHAGAYECVAHNPFLGKKIRSHRIVTLRVRQGGVGEGLLRRPPARMSVSLYSNVTVECAAAASVAWTRQDGRPLPPHRFHMQGGNLLIFGVRREDEDVYSCEAGGEAANTTLQVQELPEVLRLAKSVWAGVGGNLSLHCQARGNPRPTLKWMHNARTLPQHTKAHLFIGNVSAQHSGIYQCFATSPLGVAYASSHVTVDAEGGRPPKEEGDYRRHHKKKHTKGVRLIPPSRPELSRLSDQSVMVRWEVGVGGGLPIHFFKVQWREVGEDWMTVDEDIPAHIHSYAVLGLRTGGVYRFRVAAVYSNHDNKMGGVSAKFVLTRDTQRLANAPRIVRAEANSPSHITLHWTYEEGGGSAVEGFFLHYRPSHSAGGYAKEAVVGASTRSHTVSHLLPDTGYDLKVQSFNRAAASHFSNIVTAKTRVSESVSRGRSKGVVPPPPEDSPPFPLPYVVAGAGGAGLVLAALACLCLWRKKKPTQRGEGPNGGYLPCNISVNPLSQMDDKPDDIEVVISNNNEIIRLQTFSSDEANGAE